MIITATIIDLTEKRTRINHRHRVGGKTPAATTPSATQPSPPRRTNQAIPRTPREGENSAASPSPTTATFQSIRRKAKREHKHTHNTAQKQPPPRQRSARNSRTAGTPPPITERPEFRRPEDARRPAGRPERNRSSMRRRRPRGTHRRQQERQRTARGDGGWSAAAVRSGRETAGGEERRGWGEEKKLVGGEVGEGYKEGGSHLPPLFLSLASLSLSSLCDDKARRLDSYPSLSLFLSTAASPASAPGFFLSLHLLPLIT